MAPRKPKPLPTNRALCGLTKQANRRPHAGAQPRMRDVRVERRVRQHGLGLCCDYLHPNPSCCGKSSVIVYHGALDSTKMCAEGRMVGESVSVPRVTWA